MGPRGPRELRSVGVRISEEGQAKSCQSPRGEKRSCKLGPPPRSCAPRTLQAACRAPEPEGFEEETQDARTQLLRPFALLFRNGTKKPLPGPLPRGKAGLDLAPTWSWETAFSSHSGRHQKKLHSRTSTCACKADKMGAQWVSGPCSCLVDKSCPTLCNHGLHTPGSSVLDYPLEFAHIHVH